MGVAWILPLCVILLIAFACIAFAFVLCRCSRWTSGGACFLSLAAFAALCRPRGRSLGLCLGWSRGGLRFVCINLNMNWALRDCLMWACFEVGACLGGSLGSGVCFRLWVGSARGWELLGALAGWALWFRKHFLLSSGSGLVVACPRFHHEDLASSLLETSCCFAFHVLLVIEISGYYSARVAVRSSLFLRYSFANCVLEALVASFSVLGSIHLSLRERRRPWREVPKLFVLNVNPVFSNSYYELSLTLKIEAKLLHA